MARVFWYMAKPARFLCIVAVVLSALYSSGAWAAGTFSVTHLGAAGDGKTKDTAAFQKALHTAAANGGTVDVPAGNYLVGSIILSSNVTLRLEKGADLIGIPDVADYHLISVRYEGEYVSGHRALISANNVQGTGLDAGK
jgi:polygalacturonase